MHSRCMRKRPSHLSPANCMRLNVGFPVRLGPTAAHARQSRRGADSTHCAGDNGAHAERRLANSAPPASSPRSSTLSVAASLGPFPAAQRLAATEVRRRLRAETGRSRPRASQPIVPNQALLQLAPSQSPPVRRRPRRRHRAQGSAQGVRGGRGLRRLCRGGGRWTPCVEYGPAGGLSKTSRRMSTTPSRGLSTRGRSGRNRSPALRQRGSLETKRKRLALELSMDWSDQPRCPAGSRIGPSC